MPSPRPISCLDHVPKPSIASAAAGVSRTGWQMPSPSDFDDIIRSRLSNTLPRCISRTRTCRSSFDELFAVGALDDDEGFACVPDGPSSSTSLATFCPTSQGKTAPMNIPGKALGPLSKLDEKLFFRDYFTYHPRPQANEEDDVTRISALANANVGEFEPIVDHEMKYSLASPRTLLPPLFNDKDDDDITTPSCSSITPFGSWNGFEAGVGKASEAAPRATLDGSAAPILDHDDDDHRIGSWGIWAGKSSCEVDCDSIMNRPSIPPILMTTEFAPGTSLIPSSPRRHTPDPHEDLTFQSPGQITRFSRDRANSTISAVTSLEAALPPAPRSKARVASRRCLTTPLTLNRNQSSMNKKKPDRTFSNALLNSFHHLDRRGSLPFLSTSTPPETSTQRSSSKTSNSLVPSQRRRSNSVISLANLSSMFEYVGRTLNRSLSPKPLTSTTPSKRPSSTRPRTWSLSGAASTILSSAAGTTTPTPYRWEDVVSLKARFCTSSDSTSGLNSFLLGLHDMEQGGKSRTWDPRVACSEMMGEICTSPSSSSFSNTEQVEEVDLSLSTRWPNVETTWGEPAQVIVNYVGGSQNVFAPRELTPPQIANKILNPSSLTFPSSLVRSSSSPRSKI